MKRTRLTKRRQYTKKALEKKVNTTASYGSFENFDNDDSIFASINGDDLKKEVAKNVKLAMKTDTIDIFITRPFRNAIKLARVLGLQCLEITDQLGH